MNPKFRDWKPPPPVRTDEEQRAKESKSLVAQKKAAKTAKSETPSTPPPPRPGGIAYPDRDEYQEKTTSSVSATPKIRSQRSGIKRKAYDEAPSDSELPQDNASSVTGDDPPMKTKVAKAKGIQISETASIPSALGEELHSNIDESNASSSKTSTFLNGSHLENGSTIILGAGLLGLFTARDLAHALKEAKTTHQITVIDVRGGYCELASGHCLGGLSTHGMPEEWSSIAEAARDCWQDILSDDDVQKRLEFQAASMFNVPAERGLDQAKGPSWLREPHDMSIVEDSLTIGKM